jgi:acyl carrier protein
MATTKNKLHAFLGRFFQNMVVEDEQDFFAQGLVNSLFAMQLVVFVENEFGIVVSDEDLDIDNFRTINAIASLIERKMISSTL